MYIGYKSSDMVKQNYLLLNVYCVYSKPDFVNKNNFFKKMSAGFSALTFSHF